MTETGSVPDDAPPTARTRVGGYALCLDGDDRILLARLSAVEIDVGAWTLPGGGIEFGEHPDDAVLRELEEETGYRGEVGRVAAVFSHLYHHSPAANGGDLHFLGVLYHVRIVGGALRDEIGGTTDTARWFRRDELDDIRLVEIGRFGVDVAFRTSSSVAAG
ncbi:MAG TPA: NUDIX domain-containing protein [Candidatus Limnocylindrales bacterium]|jgi:ADP-ribose pyrophosphatase YjhB (NUDIX family)|nr:NUDIX domain-containing protein [Candidatus Limnocylindrales bacterium]